MQAVVVRPGVDGYAASYRAVREVIDDGLLPEDTKVRTSKYLNNQIEQDRRNIKLRTNVMLGFKRFWNATITISGIDLMHRIRKGNYERLATLPYLVARIWRKWLSRRSNERSMPWVAFARILKLFPLPQPRIVHNYAKP